MWLFLVRGVWGRGRSWNMGTWGEQGRGGRAVQMCGCRACPQTLRWPLRHHLKAGGLCPPQLLSKGPWALLTRGQCPDPSACVAFRRRAPEGMSVCRHLASPPGVPHLSIYSAHADAAGTQPQLALGSHRGTRQKPVLHNVRWRDSEQEPGLGMMGMSFQGSLPEGGGGAPRW